MSDISLQAIEALLDSKFDEKLEPINVKLDALQETVAAHTTALDTIVKNTNDWNTEMTVMRNRLDRFEGALKHLGQKLHVDLNDLLH